MKSHCNKHEEQFINRLKTSGLKVTPARLGVLDVLAHFRAPMRVKDIKKHLQLSRINLATVYRTVKGLHELGLISSPALSGVESYYELPVSHHHHIVCVKCGKIKELQDCRAELKKSGIEQTGFVKVLRHSLEYFGLCRKCV